jgi:hypothetical protein
MDTDMLTPGFSAAGAPPAASLRTPHVGDAGQSGVPQLQRGSGDVAGGRVLDSMPETLALGGVGTLFSAAEVGDWQQVAPQALLLEEEYASGEEQ